MTQVKFLKSILNSAGWKEMEATDDITLNSFSGDGSNLTDLNMSNASSGVLSKDLCDPNMAGLGLSFDIGVLSVSVQSASGLGVNEAGVYVNYDGTTLGMVDGQLAVLPDYATNCFSIINFISEDSITSTTSNDSVNFIAGNGMSFETNAESKSITFISETNVNTGSSRPEASSITRGQIYITTGATGVADVAEICLKSSTDTYSWVQLSIG